MYSQHLRRSEFVVIVDVFIVAAVYGDIIILDKQDVLQSCLDLLVTETGIRSGFVESTDPEVCKVEANHGLWPASVNMEQKKKSSMVCVYVCLRVCTCVYSRLVSE